MKTLIIILLLPVLLFSCKDDSVNAILIIEGDSTLSAYYGEQVIARGDTLFVFYKDGLVDTITYRQYIFDEKKYPTWNHDSFNFRMDTIYEEQEMVLVADTTTSQHYYLPKHQQ